METNIELIEKITSKENKTYKNMLKLKLKKYRDKEGTYLIEGENLVMDCLQKGGVSLIIFSESKFKKNRDILNKTREFEKLRLCIFEDKLFEKIAETENSQGIIGVAKKKNITMAEFFADGNKKIIVLDKVSDPGNIGTIIRTARATDHKIILTKGTVDPYSPKVVRASMGAILDIPLIQSDSYEELVEVLKRNEIPIVGAILNGNTPFEELNLTNGGAIILGNEGEGISEELIKKIDIGVTIPMEDKVESLNVSIAGALLMYKAYLK